MQTRWGADPAVARACDGLAADLGIPAAASHHTVTLPPFRARPPLESSP